MQDVPLRTQMHLGDTDRQCLPLKHLARNIKIVLVHWLPVLLGRPCVDQIASRPNDTTRITVSIYSMLTARNSNVLHMFHGNFCLFYGHESQPRVDGNNGIFHYDLCPALNHRVKWARTGRRRKTFVLVLLPVALRPFQFGLGFLYNWCPFNSVKRFDSLLFGSHIP
jgi:hypothetical protein